MGYGSYSADAYQAIVTNRADVNTQHVFKQQKTHPLMDPRGVKLRESRDSNDHPNSTPIVFALDVTGSMGKIPVELARGELPKFMTMLLEAGVPDPQVLFMAVGDAYSDHGSLQVGQFESTAELMDQWLTFSFLEGGGGGQNTESYELALYFLATHTETDAWTKRKQRGLIFLTGDELPYPTLPAHVVETIIGDRLTKDLTFEEILAEVQTAYEVFFIIPHNPPHAHNETAWRKVLGDHVLRVDSASEVCFACAGAALLAHGKVASFDDLMAKLAAAGLGSAKSSVARALQPLAAHYVGSPGIIDQIKSLFNR